MRKFLVVGLLIFFITANVQVIASDTFYDKMISTIDEWLKSNNQASFTSADDMQVFKWRVGIETLGYDSLERFTFYSKLLKEIDNKEFTYNYIVYNNRSIRIFMLENYPSYDRPEEIQAPDSFFVEMYDWYKENTTSKREQAYWLVEFVYFLSNLSSDDAALVANSCYSQIQDILKQYIAIMDYYLVNEPGEIPSIENIYTSLYTIFSSKPNEYYFLKGLSTLSSSNIGKFIKQEDRNIVLNYILPKFMDSEEVIRIYARWSD